MNRVRTLVSLTLLCLLSAAVQAQTRLGVSYGHRWLDDVVENNTAVRISENESINAALEFRYSPVADWQVYLSRFSSQLKTSPSPLPVELKVVQLGGIRWLDEGAFRPYVGSTAGVTQLDVEGDTLTRFSLSLMTGLHWDIGTNFGIRTEARWNGAFLNSDTALSCVNGVCRIEIHSGVWAQAEVNAGIYWQF